MKTVSSAPFSNYDTVDYLQDEQDITVYLDAALDDGDPALIAAAHADHADIARARNTLLTPVH